MVDILIPYYGTFLHLKEAVDSVLKQTYANYRIFIIDDCYPDNTAYEYYKNAHVAQVTYVRHQQNLGITNNFNYALAHHATAEFCALMGCDDRMKPDYLERALRKIGSSDFYQPGVEIIDSEGNISMPLADRIKKIIQPGNEGALYGETLVASLCYGNWLYFPSILWKSETIAKYGFDPIYYIVEDLDLEFKMILNGATLYFDKGATTFQYRRHGASLSSKEKQGLRFSEERSLYQKYAERFDAAGWHKAARVARMRPTSRINHLLSRLSSR